MGFIINSIYLLFIKTEIMYEIIQKAHSGIAYLALLALVLAVVNSYRGYSSRKPFEKKDKMIALFALILCHLQLVLGLAVYYVSPIGFELLGDMETAARLTSLEHPLINVFAIAVVTIGWSKHKKEESDTGKFKKITFLYLAGLLLILSRIPWTNWFN